MTSIIDVHCAIKKNVIAPQQIQEAYESTRRAKRGMAVLFFQELRGLVRAETRPPPEETDSDDDDIPSPTFIHTKPSREAKEKRTQVVVGVQQPDTEDEDDDDDVEVQAKFEAEVQGVEVQSETSGAEVEDEVLSVEETPPSPPFEAVSSFDKSSQKRQGTGKLVCHFLP